MSNFFLVKYHFDGFFEESFVQRAKSKDDLTEDLKQSYEDALQSGEQVEVEIRGTADLYEGGCHVSEISRERAEELVRPTSIEIDLTPGQEEYVRDVAKNNGISPSSYVKHLFEKGLHLEQKREEDRQVFTVVGTSAHHPDGFTRVIEAESPEAAAEKPEDAHVHAVVRGDHANALA